MATEIGYYLLCFAADLAMNYNLNGVKYEVAGFLHRCQPTRIDKKSVKNWPNYELMVFGIMLVINSYQLQNNNFDKTDIQFKVDQIDFFFWFFCCFFGFFFVCFLERNKW